MADETTDAVRALVENHRAFLSFLEKRLGRRDVAEDVLQEAFARGLDKLSTLRDGEAAIPWFYRMLRNAAVDHQRRGGAAARALARFAHELEEVDEPTRDEICQCIGRLAGTLKPEYADALRRIEIDGVTVKDYAAERGLSSGNAAVRVHRAREALRRQLAASCGTCAEHGCVDCSCGTAQR
jgi:RNA polymerase sigma factor (sigma-70 family)